MNIKIIHCKDLLYLNEILTLIEHDISLGHFNNVPIEFLKKRNHSPPQKK